MATDQTSTTDVLLKYSRRSLWVLLGSLTILAGAALVSNFFPDSAGAAMAQRVFTLFPIAIVIALGALRGTLGGVAADPGKGAMKALLSDEWRLQCLNRAYRNALFAVLLAQALLALLLTVFTVASPVATMASATAFIGVATVLVSMLVYDR